MKNQKFSKRHYIAIAEIIKNTENNKREVAKNLAKMFSEDNESSVSKNSLKPVE
jgi:hypothetical protein